MIGPRVVVSNERCVYENTCKKCNHMLTTPHYHIFPRRYSYYGGDGSAGPYVPCSDIRCLMVGMKLFSSQN